MLHPTWGRFVALGTGRKHRENACGKNGGDDGGDEQCPLLHAAHRKRQWISSTIEWLYSFAETAVDAKAPRTNVMLHAARQKRDFR
jgi:hypothetical protein